MLTATGKKAMCADDKCMLRTVSANGLWPRKRQADARYPVEPFCEMCNSGAIDTVRHRAWACPHPDAVARREQLATAATISEACGNPDSALFCRAIGAHPAEQGSPVAAVQHLQFWKNCQELGDRSLWKMSGSVFYDGSCLKHAEPELSTATFAVTQVNAERGGCRLAGNGSKGHAADLAVGGELRPYRRRAAP